MTITKITQNLKSRDDNINHTKDCKNINLIYFQIYYIFIIVKLSDDSPKSLFFSLTNDAEFFIYFIANICELYGNCIKL